ncbi:helix-turn-helix transcriptional regulator [Jonesia quinghaiensis]|uniref:helix-turn-helix transcriptional regulator n=1 Tax=Jonesia quinghaiensis TaxID=262806 RepID=UPI0003FB00A1|nr:WYL domain-containing protein [Jonesia quinghaiensis]
MATTTSRLLSLLSLLQTRRDWPGALLAERLNVSHRTVRRDVDRLRDMGYNISATMGPDGGYHLDAGNELPPLLFDDDQAIALAVALQTATLSGANIEEAAVRALATVRQVMPSRVRHRLAALTFTALTGPTGGNTDKAQPDVLVALSAAIRSREVMRFDYAQRHTDQRIGEPAVPTDAPRRVEPHHLVTTQGRWYLVAWDLQRDGWRIFRADRISPRTPTGPRFMPRELPGGDAAEFVAARFKGADRRNEWPCVGRVIVHRSASEVAPFAGDGIVEALDSQRCSLTLGAWSWVALAATLNSFDADIDVLNPPQLADAFALLAARNRATASQ